MKISEIYDRLQTSKAVKAIIPMGYTPGMPMLMFRGSKLYLQVPWVRYRVTGEVDKTAVYPVRYVTLHTFDTGHMVHFEDLASNPIFYDLHFDQPCGIFRHEAVKHLDRKQYMTMRNAAYDALDSVAEKAGIDGFLTPSDDLAFLMGILVEPSLMPIYESLNPPFVYKYLRHLGV